ncbi:MAG: phosphatidylinositol-specific phospholipase C1-like protein [Bryobacteraceae bacterium]|nr:phosphatidylinositol-specific phospholipase C1-like protein [Bryobacteraceae bacterium]
MNQVTVLGSHNSYKKAIDSALKPQLPPNVLRGLDYSHLPLSAQLDMGLRALELDVVHDPNGGLYATPMGLKIPGSTPYDPDGEMKRPGLKVLHVPDIDFRSNNYTFRSCLRELKAWSDAHRTHLPIVITMNAKDEGIAREGAVTPLKFDKAAFDVWDAEIREMLPAEKLITPDDIRGTFDTLEAAVLAHNWPTLDRVRGRFLFVLDETTQKLATYTEGHASLKGRVMFMNARPGQPEAAVLILNDPIAQQAEIQYAVRSGYLVRTRADADTAEARKGDYTRLQSALASGAQIVSTDYYVENPEFKTGYKVVLPGGNPARWNILMLPEVRPLPRTE